MQYFLNNWQGVIFIFKNNEKRYSAFFLSESLILKPKRAEY